MKTSYNINLTMETMSKITNDYLHKEEHKARLFE